MTERQLIADLLSALEYHAEQTRPIEFSKVAIAAAREYLQKPEQPAPVQQGQVIGNTVFLSREELARLFPQPVEGCDFCNNPLYAGTVCKNCGRLAEQEVERINQDTKERIREIQAAALEQPAQQEIEPPSDENIADAWVSASDSDGIAYDGPSFERGYRLGRGEYDEYTGALVAAALAEQPAQPQQEPVAWIDPKHLEWLAQSPDNLTGAGLAARQRSADMVSLYTSPPAQRKPLTDEQEREAFEAHWYSFYHSGSVSARSDGSYVHPHVQRAWEAWQARAAHGTKASA